MIVTRVWWFKSSAARRWRKQVATGLEPGLYALTGFSGSAHLAPSNMEYGKCKCELGCECDDDAGGG